MTTQGPTMLSARTVVERVRSGELTAEALVIELLDTSRGFADLNAFISIDEERVISEARAVDDERARGHSLGPLAGLPFVIKDQIDVAGYPTTMGHPAFERYIAQRHADVVERIVAAGGLVFAKTNCGPMVGAYPGRALSAATNNNPYYGPVRNPYDNGRVSGGSSGGNAAAIAAGIAPAGIGEDTGGSIRIPSAWCGIAGLRPSTFTIDNALVARKNKRYPDRGIVPPPGYLETTGPMARTVADLAFIDAVLSGEATPTVGLAGVRIGVPDERYWDGTICDPLVRATVADAFAGLRGAGAELVEIDLAAIVASARAMPVPVGKPVDAFASWLSHHVPDLGVQDSQLLPRRPFATGSPAVMAETRQGYRRLFEANDLMAVAFPAQLTVAPLIHSDEDTMDRRIQVAGTWVNEFELILSTTLWGAVLGAPSLSVPAGFAGGLPVGVMLQGLPGGDARILGLGVAVEERLGPIAPPPLPVG